MRRIRPAIVQRQRRSQGMRNAKLPPVTNASNATPYNAALIRRSRVQARAARGSAGHGSDRARQINTPLAASSTAAMPNTQSFSCDSQTSCGIAVTSEASAAPAPSETMTAGSTQQSSVALLAISVPKATLALRAWAFTFG